MIDYKYVLRKEDELSIFLKLLFWVFGRIELFEVVKIVEIVYFRVWVYDILKLRCRVVEIVYVKYDNSCRFEIIFIKLEYIWYIF